MFYLKGKKDLYLAPLVPRVPLALRGHQASLASLAFLEAMLWGLRDPQDPLGHRALQAIEVQQV